MKEWTRNNFYDRITEHLNASITSEDELVAVNTELYSEIIETGKDSRRFFPSMYDFLARRAIELFRQIDTDEDLTRTLKKKNILSESLFTPSEQFIEIDFSPKSTEYNLWALETYKKLIRSLSARGLKNSVLLTDLDRIEYLSQLQTTYASNIQPLFSKLLEEWEGNEFSVEIVDKIASMNLYEIGVSRSDNLAADQKKEKLYNLLKEYINWYPDYERISLLENHLQRLTNPSFTVRKQHVLYKKKKKVKASYRNLKSLMQNFTGLIHLWIFRCRVPVLVVDWKEKELLSVILIFLSRIFLSLWRVKLNLILIYYSRFIYSHILIRS